MSSVTAVRAAFRGIAPLLGDAMPHIVLEPGAIGAIVPWLHKTGYRRILLVDDPNTGEAAGHAVMAILSQAGFLLRHYRFPQPEPKPDEESLGCLLAACLPTDDLILGVGSGVIGDVCKFVASRTGKPCALVATAPSMDGYSSGGSALLLRHVKHTPAAAAPTALFCDTNILKNAPLLMIATGLGDILGKYIALADWHLSHIMTGEQMPEAIVEAVKQALSACVKAAPHLASRDESAIEALTEALILSGLAMTAYGESRPASGTEHHLAHFWEMRAHMEGSRVARHGALVGVATCLALRLWKALPDLDPSSFANMIHDSQRVSVIREQYGSSAEDILKAENPLLPAEKIAAHWPEIISIAQSLPAAAEIENLLRMVDGAVHPTQVYVNKETVANSVKWARERKKTVTVLQMMGNLGMLDDCAQHVAGTSQALAGVKCFILDLDGTVYLDGKLFPFSLEFLQTLRTFNIDFVFFTNNSSETRDYYLKKLENMGIVMEKRQIFTATEVLLDALPKLEKSKNAYISVTPQVLDSFAQNGYYHQEDEPDFAILGFDKTIDYAKLTRLCDIAREGKNIYGINEDRNCPTVCGYIPDCGSLSAVITTATGKSVQYFGKPTRQALDFIIAQTGYREDELCVVGDRWYTDIALAKNSSVRSVLVLSGDSDQNYCGSGIVPDMVLRDLSELTALLKNAKCLLPYCI